MLSPQHRLRHSLEVRQVQQNGQTWRHPLVVLLATPNTLKESRFAFVASRRVGKAVVRNHVKRRLRESIRLALTTIKPGWDCLFIARPAIGTAAFAEVQTAVLALLQRAGLFVNV